MSKFEISLAFSTENRSQQEEFNQRWNLGEVVKNTDISTKWKPRENISDTSTISSSSQIVNLKQDLDYKQDTYTIKNESRILAKLEKMKVTTKRGRPRKKGRTVSSKFQQNIKCQ